MGYYFSTHLRVVAALLVREMASRFGNKPGGYIWAVLDPAAHISFLSVIFMSVARTPLLGTNFPLFFATGYIAYQYYQSVVGFLNGAVKANQALLSYPNVALIDPIVARYLLQVGTTTFVALVVFSTIFIISGSIPDIIWPYVIEAAFVASIMAAGVAMFNNVFFSMYPAYEQIYGMITRPLFMLSGVFFLPSSLPHPFRDYVLINPVAHVLMLFRKGFYPQYRAIGLDTDYLYTVAVCAFFIGLVTFTNSRAALRRK